MRKSIRVSVFLTAVLTLLLPHYSIAQNLDNLSKAVVQIHAPDGTGSGIMFIQNNEVMILTSRHVAEGFTKFGVGILENPNRPAVTTFTALLHRFSPDVDAALLRVPLYMDGRPVIASDLRCRRNTTTFCLPDLTFQRNLTNVRRGDVVSILGYPGIGDNELIFSTGHIASVLYEDLNGTEMPVLFRTNATVSSGNSGGMAFNEARQVIGMPALVRFETETATSLGILLSMQAVWAALESDNVMTNWEDFFPENDGLDPEMDPLYGTIPLAAGFVPDPSSVSILAGGENRIRTVGPTCTGYAATAPDYRLEWSGSSDLLYIYFSADNNSDDTTLIVRSPDGAWHCNDDAGGSINALNPLISFENPAEGSYLMWVGSYAEQDLINGTLYISELYPEELKY
ncbi:MAG: serine protease [Balneolales bacterium]|nr:serine protease [Balneolales bacterium]